MTFELNQQPDSSSPIEKKSAPSSWVRTLMLAGGLATTLLSVDAAGNKEYPELSPADRETAAENFIGKPKESFTLQDIIETQVMFNQMPYEQVIYNLVDKALDSSDPVAAFAEVQKEIEQQTKHAARFVDYEIVTQRIIDHYSSLAKDNPEMKAEHYQTMRSLIQGMSESFQNLVTDFWEAHSSAEGKETFEGLRNEYWKLLDDRYVAFQEIEKSQGIPNAHLLNPDLGQHEQFLKTSEKQKQKLENQLEKILSAEEQKMLIALEQAESDLEKAEAFFTDSGNPFVAQK